MNIFGFLKDLVSPVSKLIDDVHTSDEERLKLKNAFEEMSIGLESKIIEYETKLLQSRASVIEKEIGSTSWLSRSWRPGLMALFGVIIFHNYILHPYLLYAFGVDVMMDIPDKMWTLIEISLGGYIVGRSAEKSIKIWKDKK